MTKNTIPIILLLCLGLVSCKKAQVQQALPQMVTLEDTNKANVMTKLRLGQHVKIACEGTSLTYGEDIKGTDTIAPSLPGGPTRAIYQYPGVMLQTLNNPLFYLSLRGFPGDRTTEAITRWQDSTQADICIIEYGTNDAYNFAGYASGTVPVATYTAQLSVLVERRINQGAWVILCISPSLQSGDTNINAYRTAAMTVAKYYNVDYYDINKCLIGLTAPYSDVIHFNSTGYHSWGIQIATVVATIK